MTGVREQEDREQEDREQGRETEDRKMEGQIKSFKDLKIWQKAYVLTLSVYRLTKDFSREELYGIMVQMRRAAVSVVSNIAEGYFRKSKMEYIQFLSIAYGSLSELETQILLSKDLKYSKETEAIELLKLKDEIAAMLYILIKKLRSN